jgi:hypothetical protein
LARDARPRWRGRCGRRLSSSQRLLNSRVRRRRPSRRLGRCLVRRSHKRGTALLQQGRRHARGRRLRACPQRSQVVFPAAPWRRCWCWRRGRRRLPRRSRRRDPWRRRRQGRRPQVQNWRASHAAAEGRRRGQRSVTDRRRRGTGRSGRHRLPSKKHLRTLLDAIRPRSDPRLDNRPSDRLLIDTAANASAATHRGDNILWFEGRRRRRRRVPHKRGLQLPPMVRQRIAPTHDHHADAHALPLHDVGPQMDTSVRMHVRASLRLPCQTLSTRFLGVISTPHLLSHPMLLRGQGRTLLRSGGSVQRGHVQPLLLQAAGRVWRAVHFPIPQVGRVLNTRAARHRHKAGAQR